MPSSSPLSKPVLRRTTFAAAPLALVAGCKWTDDGSDPIPEQSEPAVAADDKLVDEALAAISATSGVVDAVARKHIGLSSPLSALTKLHREQATTLEGDVDEAAGSGSGQKIPDGDKKSLDLVVRQERSLQDILTGLAGRAASGSLAGTLASMAAGVAQQRVVLKATKVGGAA